MAPNYILDLCVPVTSVPISYSRSVARGDFVVLRTRLRLDNRAFYVAGLTAWNSLPSDIRTASTLSTFKKHLKTHLFSAVLFCSFTPVNLSRAAYSVRPPCSDFTDMFVCLVLLSMACTENLVRE